MEDDRKSAYRSTVSAEGANTYMMDDKLAGDARKQRIDRIQQSIVQEQVDALPEGAVVLDVPCGNGRMSQLLEARPDLQLVAVDYSFEMLQAMPLRGDLKCVQRRIRGDIMHTPMPDRSVDLLINMRLLHHIGDRAKLVSMCREMARVSRGIIVTTYWTTHCWRYLRRRLIGKRIRGYPIGPAVFHDVLREVGLEALQVTPMRRFYEDEVMVVCRKAQ